MQIISRVERFFIIVVLGFVWTSASADLLAKPEVIAKGGGSLFGSGSMQVWEIEKITDDIYGFRHTFYRSIFIVTPDGIIATDPLNPDAGRVLREEMRKITDQPVKYVSYTHSHWDHITGGQPFKDDGATFVAQERCAENFIENPHPDVVMPDITYRDRYTIELGGKSMTMYYFGPTHDNCLVVMHIQPENVMFIADLANPPNGWIMFYNPAVSEDRVWNMVAALDSIAGVIEREGIDTIIGGHMTTSENPQTGRLGIVRGTIGPSTTVAERRDFWQALIDGARNEMAAGTPADEVAEKLVADGYLADRIIVYDGPKMQILIQRMVSYIQTGE